MKVRNYIQDTELADTDAESIRTSTRGLYVSWSFERFLVL